jgi:hypothetical protein
MGKLKKIFLLLLVFCFAKSNATDTTLNLKLLQTIKGSYTDFSIDNLGNIFLTTSSNQIKKLNEKLDSVGVFNDVKRYGNISLVDVSNPLKVLVYYKDFATIVVLDRFLNTRNTIDLRKQNILQVKAIAQSYDNNIWLFDELDAKIKKIDEAGKLLQESADFRLLFDDVPNPSTIIDANSQLYLYSKKNGWLVFDYYGAMKSKYSILGWQDVQVTGNNLTGRDSVYFYSSQPAVLKIAEAKPSIAITNAIKVINLPQRCYILRKEGLEIYATP